MRDCEKCIYHTDNGCSKWECKGTVTLEDYKAQIRAEVVDEVLQIIHITYTQDLHCMADYCERDTQGYDCEDCLYKSIRQNLEQLKEQKGEQYEHI